MAAYPVELILHPCEGPGSNLQPALAGGFMSSAAVQQVSLSSPSLSPPRLSTSLCPGK